MKRGYLKLWRACVDNELYFSEPFTKWQAWQDLLVLANHKKRVVYVRGIAVTVDAGQVLAAEEFLAERWQWSRGKVRRFMSYLESKTVQQIVQQKSRVCTIITIVKWDIYQSDGTINGTTDSTTNGQQTDIPKNVKNGKNEKNKSLYADFIKRFNGASGKRCRVLDEKTKRQLNARIRDGFTLDEIIDATRNCANDDFHKENPKYLTPEFITRSDKLQKYINVNPKGSANKKKQYTDLDTEEGRAQFKKDVC